MSVIISIWILLSQNQVMHGEAEVWNRVWSWSLTHPFGGASLIRLEKRLNRVLSLWKCHVATWEENKGLQAAGSSQSCLVAPYHSLGKSGLNMLFSIVVEHSIFLKTLGKQNKMSLLSESTSSASPVLHTAVC